MRAHPAAAPRGDAWGMLLGHGMQGMLRMQRMLRMQGILRMLRMQGMQGILGMQELQGMLRMQGMCGMYLALLEHPWLCRYTLRVTESWP